MSISGCKIFLSFTKVQIIGSKALATVTYFINFKLFFSLRAREWGAIKKHDWEYFPPSPSVITDQFLVADTQLKKRGCPTFRPSVCLSVGPLARVKSWKTDVQDAVWCMCVGFGVGMEVGCLCPTVRNDVATPRHLLLLLIYL